MQRRLRVGYARAARLLDILEDQGFIGPADGAKPREILASPEMIQQMTRQRDDDIPVAEVTEADAADSADENEAEEIVNETDNEVASESQDDVDEDSNDNHDRNV